MKRVCSVCKTTSFKKSSDSGLVCKYGHKVLGIQQEQAEDEAYISGMRMRRKIKATKETSKLTPSQHKSYELQIMQFGLQLMGRAMVQDLHFPPEFETTLRELWLFFLSESKAELEETYLFDAKEKHKIVEDPFETDNFEDLSIFQEEDDDEDKNTRKETEDSQPRELTWPSLSYPQTLSFIYLTCIYLRYPVLPADIITWCETEQLPYIIVNRIPEDILGAMSLDRITKMHRPPTVLTLRLKTFRIARALRINSGLKIPDYNTPLLLDRFCSYFFLPVEGHFYASYLYKEAVRADSFKDKTKGSRWLRNPSVGTWEEHRLTPVSALLLACVIATAKIFYNIDGCKA
ncbi:hypothetical protein G6F56_010836 [Rhizopus delemar]|nr:hypothetical protein G6F56_010836 [Rhizopus delemar]